MRALVTGGAGFIGSHLVDRLVERGDEVVVIDNCTTGREENLAAVLGHPRMRFVRGSVLDKELVASAVSNTDLVYHLAAAVGVEHVVRDPLATIVTNTRGTQIVLEAAAEHGARVLFASTSEIYGQSADAPFREDGPRVLGPTWVQRWSYSTSKAVDEHLCFAHSERGMPVSIVRYFNIYGPRMDPAGYGSVIARFITQALEGQPLTVHGDGGQSRCFTYVSEAVDATILAATSLVALGRGYNVGSTIECTINGLAQKILEVTGSGSPIVLVPYEDVFGRGFADTRRRIPDVRLASEELGWQARIGLEDGLRRTLRERGTQA